MINGYRLSVKNGRKVDTYLYPLHGELRCFADVFAALILGRGVLIEPPGADAWGGEDDVRNRDVPVVATRGSILVQKSGGGT